MRARRLPLPFWTFAAFLLPILLSREVSSSAPAATGNGGSAAAARAIVVGDVVYDPPFDRHVSPSVTRLLKQRARREAHRLGGPGDPLEEATWLVELGLAHRSVVEESHLHRGMADDVDAIGEQVKFSVNALKQAVQIYLGMLQEMDPEALSDDDGKDNLNLRLGVAYFHMAEAYSLSPLEEQYALGHEYFVQAEKLFRSILERKESNMDDRKSRTEVEINWAHCCLRLGVALLDGHHQGRGGAGRTKTVTLTEGDVQELLRNPEQAEKLLGTGLPRQQVDQAESYFRDCADIFRKAAESDENRPEKMHLQRHLATSLQNLGTVAVLKGDLEVGAKYMEEALTVYRSHIHAHHFSATEAEDTKIAVSEVYYSLAETYLQLGRYHDSKDRYRQGMAWNELYNIEQPPEESLILEGFGDATDAIEEYERVLHEYEELRGGGADDGMGGGQFVDEITGEILDRDDGYEGDLHSGLGSLYMAKGDYVLAASHLTEAVRLYELSGEQQERSMADAKFNLSILHLRNGAYMESANLYSEALDIYEAVTVEGENPLDGMDASELLTALQEQFPAFSQAAEQKETTPQPEGNGARVGPAAGDDSTKDGPPAMVLDVNAFLQQNQSSIKDEL